MKYFENEETIIALSTPLGRGAIAVIRLSGKNSLTIINQIFSKRITSDEHRHAIFGNIHSQKDPNKIIDEVVVIFYQGPNSYTGEDLIEISCHCNPIIIDEIIQESLLLNSRMANPGEFTQRAFLNQKIDLSQAEAVAGIIDAKSKQSLAQSLRQLEGKLSNRIKNLKQEIIDIASLIEVSLDFNEDDVDVYQKSDLETRVKNLLQGLDKLLSSYDYGRLLNEGIKMVLLGKPNVGKSSLLNAFLDQERAIVSEFPGTTRDYIEGHMEVDGIPIQVVDTAGVRETADMIEELGVKRAIQHIETSDIVIAIFEAHQKLNNDDQRLIEYLRKVPEHIPIIVVLNKIDLDKINETEEQLKSLDLPLVQVSAKTGLQIDLLKKQIKENLLKESGVEEEEVVVTNARHKNALNRTKQTVESIYKGLEMDYDEVILAAELRSALEYVGDIIGETTAEDILNNIFGQFCIGK